MGDVQQLTPIGNCQVFADILDADVLPVAKLTKPHRQAMRSGIIPTSMQVAKQEQIFESNFEGNVILGELQDMELDITGNKEQFSDKVIEKFKEQLDKFEDIMEVQVCVAKKLQGDLSCYNLNNRIQEIFNPKFGDVREIKVTLVKKKDEVKEYFIRSGDKVINVKNNYKCINAEGVTTPVFNGNIGIVKDIDEEGYATVDFMGIGEVVLKKSECKNIELAYACTVHKCIVGDTWLHTSNGLIQLNELNNSPIVYESKVLDGNIEVFNGRELEKPSHFYNAGISNCLKITTERGYSLTATRDHKIDVLDVDGHVRVKTFDELDESDYVFISKGMNIYGDSIDLPDEWRVDELDVRSVVLKKPTKLTLEFARFLGYMVADGVVSKTGVKYGKNHKNVVDDFNNIVNQIFGYSRYREPKNVLPDGSMGGMYLTEINSKYIQQYCSCIGGIQPNDKYVPDVILKAPKQYQIEFLRGVFEDGSVCIKNDKFDHISLTAKEQLQIDQIMQMLLNLGIVCTKYYREQAANGKKYGSYTLFMYGSNCDTFIKTIGFISNEKQEKAFKYYDKAHNVDNKGIPYLMNVVKSICDKNELTFNQVDHELVRCYLKDRLTMIRLGRFINYCKNNAISDEEVSYLEDIYLNTNVQRVSKIEDCMAQTYCIEMPLTHKFVQNGIRAWNCQGSGFVSTIVGMDTGSFYMNNCELLYTALTRAKKYCVLVGNNYAISNAIKNKEVKTKQTFLKGMLLEHKDKLSKVA